MVFQDGALIPRITAYNNVAFGLKARGVGREEIETRVKRIADLLGIADMLHRATQELPKAAQRRLAIARAVVGEPGLCMFDEPFADANFEDRDTLRAEIKLLHHEFPMTKLFVTSDPLEAMTLADRVVIVRGGSVEQEGTPIDLFERPRTRFVAGYFGWPKMNFLRGVLVRSGDAGEAIRLDGIEAAVKLPPNRVPRDLAENSPILLGLRPEHMMRAIRVSPADGVFRHEAEIEALQRIGPRAYATFRVGGAAVVAELQAHDVSNPGDRIRVDINVKRATIFDATSEKTLQPLAEPSVGGAAPGRVEDGAGGE
jgi:multiple sugar transport system ATP-binding protein